MVFFNPILHYGYWSVNYMIKNRTMNTNEYDIDDATQDYINENTEN